MALVLQERGIGRYTWLEWVAGVPGFTNLPAEHIQEVVAWMAGHGMLWEEEGIFGIGQKGEETYGRRHFMELLSVFLSPPLFAVLHGRQELGFVDELTFLCKQEGHRVLLLGGRAWHVTHIDWQRKVAHVEVSQARGRTRWKGQGQGLSFRLCQAIKRVLAEDEAGPWWSQRARTQIEEVRGNFPWVTAEGTAVVAENGSVTWWTFAGQKANAALVPALAGLTHVATTSDNLMIEFERALPLKTVQQAIVELGSRDPGTLLPAVSPEALEGMKFSACLPPALGVHVLGVRNRDPMAVEHALQAPLRLVSK
jgi:ATP-dependent Lhr-like helicase